MSLAELVFPLLDMSYNYISIPPPPHKHTYNQVFLAVGGGNSE